MSPANFRWKKFRKNCLKRSAVKFQGASLGVILIFNFIFWSGSPKHTLLSFKRQTRTQLLTWFTYNVIYTKKWKFHQKEHFDKNIVDSAFQKISENEAKEVKTHLIYVGRYYYNKDCIGLHIREHHQARLRSLFRKSMNKYKLNSVMVTGISMTRIKLITKEAVEDYCNGKSTYRPRVWTIFDQKFFVQLRCYSDRVLSPDSEYGFQTV